MQQIVVGTETGEVVSFCKAKMHPSDRKEM